MNRWLSPAADQAKNRHRTRQSLTTLLFLAPTDVRKGRVEPIEWMRTCEAFAARGLSVRLVAPGIAFPDRIALEDIWRHFGSQRTFDVRIVPTPFRGKPPRMAFRAWLASASLVLALAHFVCQLVRPTGAIVYTRLPILLAPWILVAKLLPRSRRPLLVLETHAMPPQSSAFVVRRMDLIVVNSQRLREDLANRFRISLDRLAFAPLARHVPFLSLSKREARAQLGLPQDAPIACHAGKMVEENVELLLQATRLLQSKVPGFRLLFVGGNPSILEGTRRRVADLGIEGSVILAGFVPPVAVDVYLAAADVLVQHYARSVLTFEYMTPGKAYDYMSAGRPIVATDMPLFDEVFGGDGERAIKVDDDPNAFAAGIECALSLPDGGRTMAERGATYVAGLSWERRVDAVLEGLRSCAKLARSR